MKIKTLLLLISLFFNCLESALFEDLERAEQLTLESEEALPFFYNNSLMGGYFNMPSARMNKEGTLAFGAATVPPYWFYGANLQAYARLELTGSYRVFRGVLAPVIGQEGFGDDADRGANIKLALITPKDGIPYFPSISIGAEDVIGTKRFNAQYIVATSQFLPLNLELSFGWSKGRIKGGFGGIGWTPFRKKIWPFNSLSFLAEYDAIDYSSHLFEHPLGKNVSHRINYGFSFQPTSWFSIKGGSLRGEKFEGALALFYPIGTTKGFLPKVNDPPLYPECILFHEKDLGKQLNTLLKEQGFALRSLCTLDATTLWMKVVNVLYRREKEVWRRLLALLSTLPSSFKKAIVVIDADGLESHQYTFSLEEIQKYCEGKIGIFQMRALSLMKEVIPYSSSCPLFEMRKPIWIFTMRPRLISFFGSATGKFKYAFGFIAVPEGYLFDEIYYRAQVGYECASSLDSVKDRDRLNPSQLLNVRTDSVRYYQRRTISLEEAFVQKTVSLGHSTFFRIATGYFEAAYGGVALESLYYPVNSTWALGVEEATVFKRHYQGLKFTPKIRKFDGDISEFVPFVGVQYFLNFYYFSKIFPLDIKVMAGQFLAKDKGARFEVGRAFPSGFRCSLWYTLTNGKDQIGGHTYHDKGFFFALPLDFFLKRSSRTFIPYAVSAWLRDVGAVAKTGKTLPVMLREDRIEY